MRVLLLFMIVAGLAASAGVWLLPVEQFQQWAVSRAVEGRSDQDAAYAAFTAQGQAEALVWSARVGLPFVVLAAALSLKWLPRLRRTGSAALAELTTATACGGNLRTTLVRLFLLVWMALGGWHFTSGLIDRTEDWPYYRLRSGEEVLPNISFSNRAVIRYLQANTPPEARILVVTDQKPFFLAYYLYPRLILHVMHPESEFVIPLENQQRAMAAYTLDEIPEETLTELQPDYILEYFEGADFVEPERRSEDAGWVNFWQQTERSQGVPPYVVVLRPLAEIERSSGSRQ